MKHVRFFVTVGLLLSAAVCGAQDEGTAPVDPAKTQEELEQLRDYVMDAEGSVQSTISEVQKMAKIKLSGYVQARYEDHQQGYRPGSGVTRNQFTIRRARLKADARPSAHTGVTLQIDMGGTAVSLRDAYVEWYPTAASKDNSWVITAGQFKWPFGYQVVQSSGVRETPERAQFAARYFPGERDRGIKISTPLTFPIRAEFGLFNGTGANANDNTNRKDFVGRVRTSPLPWLDLGASIYLGRQIVREPSAAVAATTATIPSTGEVITITPARPAVTAVQGIKNRYGLDAQMVPFSNMVLKLEYVAGRDGLVNGNPKKSHAWYALASYNVLPTTALVGMFDRFRDGFGGTAANSRDIWHIGVNHHLTEATRARVFYQFVNDHKSVVGAARKNNVLQVELITAY